MASFPQHKPVLHNPVVLAAISAIAHGQHAMVQAGLRADQGIVHTAGVELGAKERYLSKAVHFISRARGTSIVRL